jgi:hypothetical protein
MRDLLKYELGKRFDQENVRKRRCLEAKAKGTPAAATERMMTCTTFLVFQRETTQIGRIST